MPDGDKKNIKIHPRRKAIKNSYYSFCKLSLRLRVTHGLYVVHLINKKNEWIHYRGKDCMEIFCEDLRYQTMKISNHVKNEIIPQANEE